YVLGQRRRRLQRSRSTGVVAVAGTGRLECPPDGLVGDGEDPSQRSGLDSDAPKGLQSGRQAGAGGVDGVGLFLGKGPDGGAQRPARGSKAMSARSPVWLSLAHSSTRTRSLPKAPRSSVRTSSSTSCSSPWPISTAFCRQR